MPTRFVLKLMESRGFRESVPIVGEPPKPWSRRPVQRRSGRLRRRGSPGASFRTPLAFGAPTNPSSRAPPSSGHVPSARRRPGPGAPACGTISMPTTSVVSSCSFRYSMIRIKCAEKRSPTNNRRRRFARMFVCTCAQNSCSSAKVVARETRPLLARLTRKPRQRILRTSPAATPPTSSGGRTRHSRASVPQPPDTRRDRCFASPPRAWACPRHRQRDGRGTSVFARHPPPSRSPAPVERAARVLPVPLVQALSPTTPDGVGDESLKFVFPFARVAGGLDATKPPDGEFIHTLGTRGSPLD